MTSPPPTVPSARVAVQAAGKAPDRPETPAATARTVTGRVRDPQGRPLAGIRLMIKNPDLPGTRIILATTDLDGRFETWGKQPRRPIPITLARYFFATQKETLPPDRDQVEFTFRPGPAPWTRYEAASPRNEPVPPALRERLTFVNLDPRGTSFPAHAAGGIHNNLERLPRGVHKLGDTFFRIGEKLVHVQGGIQSKLPLAVKGIDVHARGESLHFLHAAGWTAASGTTIGTYVVHCVDGSAERIPIIYGRNTAIWWSFPGRNDEPTEAAVVWTGANDETDPHPGHAIRLFAMTWTNPQPEKEIATVDVLSAGGDCDPFLVALTLSRR